MIELAKTVQFINHDKYSFYKSPSNSFEEYFKRKKIPGLIDYKQFTVAILDDRNMMNNFDLLFTTTGVVCYIKEKFALETTYEHISYDDDKKRLIIESAYNTGERLFYESKKIGEDNISTLFQFIKELEKICSLTGE